MTLPRYLCRAAFFSGLLAPLSLHAQSTLFWTEGGTDRVQASASDGSGLADLTPTLNDPWGITYDGTHVYFTEDITGQIWRMDPDGGNRVMVADVNSPNDIAVNSTNIYWVNKNGRVFRSNLDGTGATAIVAVNGSHFEGIALTAANIYWTDSVAHLIQRANLDGSGVTTLVSSGLTTPYGLQVTDSFLYWADQGTGLIQRANLNGSGVTTLLSGLSNPSDVFVTGSNLFFTEQNVGVFQANLDGTNVNSVVSGANNYRFIAGDFATIPEPTTLALGCGGLILGLVVWRRRRTE